MSTPQTLSVEQILNGYGSYLTGYALADKELDLEQAKTAITALFEYVIGAPLEVDVSWKPTLDDPYGRVQMRNQTTTPKTNISHESYETIKRQRNRLRELL